MTKQYKSVIWFLLAFIFAGILHVAEDYVHILPTPHYTTVTFLFCLVFMIYSTLLILWIHSVYHRLLPSRSRTYLVAIAVFMILYLAVRAFKYRIASTAAMIRLGWYGYYVPLLMMPTIFLMVCIRISRGGAKGKWDERLLLIPGGLLAAIILTNDLHHLVFVPKPEVLIFMGRSGTYTYRLPFYLAYAWMILAILLGIGILIKVCGKGKDKRGLWFIGADLLVWFILTELHKIKAYIPFIPPYESPEIHIFCMLAAFEFCIRWNLIPHNENYAGFFAKLPMPVAITDHDFQVVRESANVIEASKEMMKEALTSPVYPKPDQKLSGQRIRGGYAFWIVDESEVRSANERLLEANELLESENTLISYENQQKEQNAYYLSRHRIYHEIAEKMYPYQKRIEELLGEMQPGENDFRERLAMVCVLNAYVKRKTNLLLMASEENGILLKELLLATSESGRYLSYVGIKTSVDESGFHDEEAEKGDGSLTNETIMALYDCFEGIAEQMIGYATLLMISFDDEGLKLASDVRKELDFSDLSLPVNVKESEGITYLAIHSKKGGD